jgi:hypothetical protein
MMWKPRRRLSANPDAEMARVRDATYAGMFLSLAASLGFARAEAGQSREGNPDSYSWHGSHLDHSAHGGHAGGSFSDGGSGGYGGDAGGGGI